MACAAVRCSRNRLHQAYDSVIRSGTLPFGRRDYMLGRIARETTFFVSSKIFCCFLSSFSSIWTLAVKRSTNSAVIRITLLEEIL